MRQRLCRIVVVAGLLGCETDVRVSDLDIRAIQVGQLKQMLAGKGAWETRCPTALVDVRSARQYAQGHIPGKINIPVKHLVTDDPRLAGTHNIVVYASKWTDFLSEAAYKKLVALGYKNVFNFQGGLELWRR